MAISGGGWCLPGGICLGGYTPPAHFMLGYTPSINRVTDRCKDITFPQLCLQAVKKVEMSLRGLLHYSLYCMKMKEIGPRGGALKFWWGTRIFMENKRLAKIVDNRIINVFYWTFNSQTNLPQYGGSPGFSQPQQPQGITSVWMKFLRLFMVDLGVRFVVNSYDFDTSLTVFECLSLTRTF